MIVAFGSLYFVCRVLFTAELRACASALVVKFAVAVILGFALSALLLLPFLEFAQLGYDIHQLSNVGGFKAGLTHDGDCHTAIQYLLPLIFGPVLGSIFENFRGVSGLRAYWGIVPAFFAVAAVLAVLFRERLADFKSQRFLTAFFGSTLLLMLLKRYGSPLINWIGELPLSEMVVYQKYQEPLIALCIAMLAGVGFTILIERRAMRLFALSCAVVLAFMLATAGWFLGQVVALHSFLAKAFYFASLALGVGLLLVTVWVRLARSQGLARAAPMAAARFRRSAVAGTARDLHSPRLLSDDLSSAVASRPLRGRSLHRVHSRPEHRLFPYLCARGFPLSKLVRGFQTGRCARSRWAFLRALAAVRAKLPASAGRTSRAWRSGGSLHRAGACLRVQHGCRAALSRIVVDPISDH